VEFNLKLTNTLETLNQDQNLPDSEQMVYMSGRALHPLASTWPPGCKRSLAAAGYLFLRRGGYVQLPATLACGLKPVTICSDLLKPGGYGRLSQYLQAADQALSQAGADCLDEFILAMAGGGQLNQAALNNLKAYADKAVQDPRHQKTAYPYDSIKYERELPLFDCAAAPCMAQCPASQEVPRYLDFAARGEWDKAYLTVMATNPFPNMQGKVCDHLCQMKCTRLNYDDPLLIREIKRVIAEKHSGPSGLVPAASNGLKAAIIGAGPSGLSCAHFLALNGFSVEVFEAKGISGGMASDAIPAFRLDDAALATDIQAILDLGVKLHKDCRVDRKRFNELLASHDYIYIAVGAQNSLGLNIPGMDSGRVFDQLSFLSAVRRGNPPDLGGNVAVIGGGNSAMDAARTAKRLVGPKGRVIIVYRRTMSEMPADLEEVQGALEEGVELLELCAPEQVLIEPDRISGLSCARMELGGVDASGRPRPIKVPGSEFTLEIDSLIPAIGQRVDLDFFPHDELRIDPETLETQISGVFAGGDASRGASSLIKAIGDGQKAAQAIMAKAGQEDKAPVSPAEDREPDWDGLKLKQARRQEAALVPEKEPASRLDFEPFVGTLDNDTAMAEASRCLHCDIFCNVCVTVCPNRANLALEMGGISYPLQSASLDNGQVRILTRGRAGFSQKHQIVNLGDFCNECGNCTTFCPSSGAPYKDKARFHLSQASFESSDRGYISSRLLAPCKVRWSGISSLSQWRKAMSGRAKGLKVSLNQGFFGHRVEVQAKTVARAGSACAPGREWQSGLEHGAKGSCCAKPASLI
jgi:putative selenate reductase